MNPRETPGSRVSVRRAQPADLQNLLQLLAEIMEHHGWTPPAPGRLRTVLEKALSNESHLFLLAETQGRPVGMCALIFTISTWSAAEVAEVQDVLVTHSHRRAGVGRALLEAAVETARKRDCARIWLDVETWNLEAHSFYRRLGFRDKASLRFERGIKPRD